MLDPVPVLLSIHIITAIVAFGPSFGFPLMARMAADEPQHGLFVLRLTDRIERRLILPAAATMPVSGLLLVWAEGIDLTAGSSAWLWLAISLYVVAIAFAILIQLRTVDRMIELATELAASGRMVTAGPGAELARPAPAALSPAAEMAVLAARVRNGGFLLMLLIFVIVSLMAGKPAI